MTKEEYLNDWKRSRAYTRNVMEAMPEDRADFRPADGMMSFREQLLHILYAEEWFLRGILENDWEQRSEFTAENHPDLPSVKAAYPSASERHWKWIEGMEDLEELVKTPLSDQPIPKKTLLRKLVGHEIHHRGQLIVYLRMCGAEPPAYQV
ncbi:putative damage-inducible protein DinB [Melghirimyces profundicolus]|uniref:Putative damage-inducible protein DinB n=1 Tax=Melghirimyces profundicolus TaxID=1242148 RepID=A0A2T6C9E6_9BACL|nr:DinB family protein [Melghirimyces profundicolus]PTX64942.1 putative damage-inducible protein DinB [Melghirimyces profundicolus]